MEVIAMLVFFRKSSVQKSARPVEAQVEKYVVTMRLGDGSAPIVVQLQLPMGGRVTIECTRGEAAHLAAAITTILT